MIIYGGYILTGGTLDNGKPWLGVNVMLADTGNRELPYKAEIAKAKRLDSLMDALHKLPIGCPVIANFGLDGKLTELKPVQQTSSNK